MQCRRGFKFAFLRASAKLGYTHLPLTFLGCIPTRRRAHSVWNPFTLFAAGRGENPTLTAVEKDHRHSSLVDYSRDGRWHTLLGNGDGEALPTLLTRSSWQRVADTSLPSYATMRPIYFKVSTCLMEVMVRREALAQCGRVMVGGGMLVLASLHVPARLTY